MASNCKAIIRTFGIKLKSWKSKESAHNILFDGTETKLLVSCSKP